MIRNTAILLCFILGQLNYSFSQEFRKSINYLDLPGISNNAKDYYLGKFKPSDNQRTLSILDSIRTKNNLTRPFYLLLLSQLGKNADGSLSEAIGNSLKLFLESNPDNFFAFLNSRDLKTGKAIKNNWANLVAGEFMIICEDSPKRCIEKSLVNTIEKTNVDYRNDLKTFYGLMLKYCR